MKDTCSSSIHWRQMYLIQQNSWIKQEKKNLTILIYTFFSLITKSSNYLTFYRSIWNYLSNKLPWMRISSLHSETKKWKKQCLINASDLAHSVHGVIQISVVSIINNRLDCHLLYKPFNGNFLIAIKVIDYCITPSISHLHIFIFVLTTK